MLSTTPVTPNQMRGKAIIRSTLPGKCLVVLAKFAQRLCRFRTSLQTNRLYADDSTFGVSLFYRSQTLFRMDPDPTITHLRKQVAGIETYALVL